MRGISRQQEKASTEGRPQRDAKDFEQPQLFLEF